MKNDIEKSEFKDFVTDRTKSQQEIDTQLDRSDGGFQKNESSGGSRKLEREEYQDDEALGGNDTGGRKPDGEGSATNYKNGKRKEERERHAVGGCIGFTL